MRKLLSVLLSLLLVVTLLPPSQAAANEDVPFDDYGVRVNSSEAYQQLQAEEKWEEFKEKKGVALNHVWKINFSAIATPSKIKAITIEHKDKPIEVKVNYNSSKIVTVKPDKRFASNQAYTLKILLTNGKKYKMDFTTATADVEPNNKYQDSSVLYIDETIQGDLLVKPLNDEADFYKINVPKDGKLNINVRRLDTTNTVSIYLHDRDGTDGDLLAYAENKTSALLERELKAGDYYIEVSGNKGAVRYELKTSFTAKKVSPEDALQAAQDAVYALPAPMDVTAEHNDAIRTALTLIATAKALDADPIALEKLEAIVAELQKIVLPIEILAATVLNSTTFEVRFNRAVDSSLALFTVNKGATVKTVTFNANKTVAKVEMNDKLSAGTYTLSVNGVDSKVLTETVTVNPETVTSIEILGDYAVRVANGKVSIGYKVKNQYGEEITVTSLTASIGGTSVNAELTSPGTVTVPSQAKEGDLIELKLTVDGKSVTKTVKVSTQASVVGITIKGIHPDEKDNTLKETTNLEKEKFYLLVKATDQYGGDIEDPTILNSPGVISVVQTDPTIVKFKSTFEPKLIDGHLALQLTGTPKLGETTVTLAAIASGKKASHKVVVAESTRTDEINLIVPTRIPEGEDILITIDAKDKADIPNPITNPDIIKSAVSGIKFTVTPYIPHTIETDDSKNPTKVWMKFDKSNVKEGSFTIKAESSTKKVVTEKITVEGKAVPWTWEWDKDLDTPIQTEIKVPESKEPLSQKISDFIKVFDQYGKLLDKPFEGENSSYSLVVTEDNPIGGAVEVKGGVVKNRAIGTEKVTIAIYKDGKPVASSVKSELFTVTDGSVYKAYEVEKIKTIYDALGAGKDTQPADYDGEVIVLGVLENGEKERLKHNVGYTIKPIEGYLEITDIGKLKVVEEGFYYGSKTEHKRPIEIEIKSSGEVLKPEVTFSIVAPKVEEIQNSQQTIPYIAITEKAFDFTKLPNNVTDNIIAKDQYGVISEKLSATDYQFEFPDGTQVDSILKFTTVTGDHLFSNNDTKDAKVTDFSAKSSFNAFITVGNISSKNPVKVTVEEAYMPTVEAELEKITTPEWRRLDNRDDVLKMAQELVGDGYTVSIKSSDNIAITTSGKVTQQGKITRPNVFFSVKNTTKPLLNMDGEKELIVSAATEVILAAGSVGTAIAGNAKITGLKVGIKYVVTEEETKFHGVLADGTLSGAGQTIKAEAEALAEALTGTEITGLKNGTTYKVEVAKIADTGIGGKNVQTIAGIAPTDAISATAGVYTITFGGPGDSVAGDTVTIDGTVLLIVDGGDATATALEVKDLAEGDATLKDKYTFNVSAGILTITQNTGKESQIAVTAKITGLIVIDVNIKIPGKTAVDATLGTAEVNTFTITGPAKATGNVTVTFNDGDVSVVKEIAVTNGETAELVAARITTAFNSTAGWTVTNSTNTVVFTANPITADKNVIITLVNS